MHYRHNIEVTLTVSCIAEEQKLTPEEIKDFIHGLDSVTWKDEVGYGAYMARVTFVCPCDESGIPLCETLSRNE